MYNSGVDSASQKPASTIKRSGRVRAGIKQSIYLHQQQKSHSVQDVSQLDHRITEERSARFKESANHRPKVTGCTKPLIHHQRQNLKNRFQLLRTLGEGAYGKVKLAAVKATGEQVAIKYIKKTKILDASDLTRIRREIKILSSLKHKHIVNISEVFEKKDKIVIVLDYAPGGELYDYLNTKGELSEAEARRIFRQIVAAIYYCHQNKIVHRDLKLENIILDDEGNVKIADFGLANYYDENSTLTTYCGSPLYASPEIVNGRPYHGPEVDVWSLGVILYTLLYGCMPFKSSSLVSLKQQISQGDYNKPARPSDAAGLIRHMLTVAPIRRATMENVLHHWWVNFGHSHMPNDAAYNPDDQPRAGILLHRVESGVLSLTSSASLRTFSESNKELDLRPNELDSTSKALEKTPKELLLNPKKLDSKQRELELKPHELDFRPKELDSRPSRWSRRPLSLDSSGNSLSSSLGSSPAPTPGNSWRHIGPGENADNVEDDPAALVSGLLKLPLEVLEILKGCSQKSLAALLGKDTEFMNSCTDNSAKDADPNVLKDNDVQENLDLKHRSSVGVEAEKKPTRGILKKGKFSGGDSACVTSESTQNNWDGDRPKAGHLLSRLPSFRNAASGMFASQNQARLMIDMNLPEQVGVITSRATHLAGPVSLQTLPQQPANLQTLHQPQHPVSLTSKTCTSPDSQCEKTHELNDLSLSSHKSLIKETTENSLITPQSKQQQKPASITEDTNQFESVKKANDSVSSRDSTTVTYRPKGILKKTVDTSKNRLSISSIGSNSSADILDLSYDSDDSDHLVNSSGYRSGGDCGSRFKGEVGNPTRTLKYRSQSLDDGLQNLHIYSLPNLVPGDHHGSLQIDCDTRQERAASLREYSN